MTPASDRKPKVGDKPYEPMVGDRIRLPEGRIVWRDVMTPASGRKPKVGDKPYEPMVGDRIRLPEGRIVWRDESGDYQIAFNDDPPGESCAIGAKIVAQATLVSRPEKPLAVGEVVTHPVLSQAAPIAFICRDEAILDFGPDSGLSEPLLLADLRRAPEGE